MYFFVSGPRFALSILRRQALCSQQRVVALMFVILWGQQARMKGEYGVDTTLDPLPYSLARHASRVFTPLLCSLCADHPCAACVLCTYIQKCGFFVKTERRSAHAIPFLCARSHEE